MHRRRFVSLGAAGLLGLAGSARLFAQRPPADPIPVAGDDIPIGLSRLGISSDFRDGMICVPTTYRKGTPMPMLVMLHGYSGDADRLTTVYTLAERFGVIVLAPESRDVTWGMESPGFDTDSRFIGMAFRWVAEVLTVDRSRLALGGSSDGANYALNMGLAYGDTFNHLMIFSAGTLATFRRQGKPHIFLSHGTQDRAMPIDRTGRRFTAELKAQDYDILYREYEGGHGAPVEIVTEAFEWFLKPKG